MTYSLPTTWAMIARVKLMEGLSDVEIFNQLSAKYSDMSPDDFGLAIKNARKMSQSAFDMQAGKRGLPVESWIDFEATNSGNAYIVGSVKIRMPNGEEVWRSVTVTVGRNQSVGSALDALEEAAQQYTKYGKASPDNVKPGSTVIDVTPVSLMGT